MKITNAPIKYPINMLKMMIIKGMFIKYYINFK